MVIKIVDTILIQFSFLCVWNKGFCRRLDENCRDMATRIVLGPNKLNVLSRFRVPSVLMSRVGGFIFHPLIALNNFSSS